jgi:hypothetical protein
MGIGVLPPRSARAGLYLLLIAVFLGLGLATLGLLQPEPTEAADPIWACYKRSGYELRVVADPADCTRLERETQLNNNAKPIWVCLKPSSGVLVYAGNASSPVFSRCTGAPPSNFVRLPGDADTTLCVATATGKLSFPPCGPGQTPLVVPKRNTAPVAEDRAATVAEDGAGVTVQLRATDADGQGLTFAIAQPPPTAP